MRLHIIALGQKLPDWVNAGIADYSRRFPRDWALTITELKAEPRDRGKTVAQMLALEAERINLARGSAYCVALDERGERWSTKKLAENLQGWRNEAQDTAFVLGSADGLDAHFKARADKRWSLSDGTLPHGLARLILIEQLYRAISLIHNHPYHRE